MKYQEMQRYQKNKFIHKFASRILFSIFAFLVLGYPGITQIKKETLSEYLDFSSTLNKLDSLLRPSKNSPSYLVISKIDYNNIRSELNGKIYQLDTLSDEHGRKGDESSELGKNDLIKPNTPIERVEKSENNQLIKLLKLLKPNDYIFLLVFFGVLILYSIYITLRFIKINSQEISTTEQISIISRDYENYKRNTIEKERKLVRDLIDLQNKLERYEAKNK